MIPGSSFLRRPHESNDDLVVSYCSACQAMVGAAASHLILKLMESEHVCSAKAAAVLRRPRKPKSSPAKNNPAA